MIKCCVFVACLSCAVGGYIDVVKDYTVDEILEDARSKWTEAKWVYPEDDVGLEGARGSKDMLLPLLAVVLLKIFTLIPLVLTTLGLVAGFSLATSKAALLIGGGLSLYHYLRGSHILVPLAKQWEYPKAAAINPLGFLPHDLPELHTRDRITVRRIIADT